MPSRPVALVIGLLCVAASAASSTGAWLIDMNDLFDWLARIVLVVVAVLTACWGLAHLIPLAFGASFRPRRPGGSKARGDIARPS